MDPSDPLPRSTLLPRARVRLCAATERALACDVERQVDALLSTARMVPGNSHVVARADGGLWIVAGHSRLWVIFGVTAGDWTPA